MGSRDIQFELEPWEREVLLKWNHTPEVQEQLKAVASSNQVKAIRIAPYVLGWLSSDLNHAIVKRGCRDPNAIALSERLDYAVDTGDGSLDHWCY